MSLQSGCMHLYIIAYFYRPQTKLWEGNIFTPVCDSVHRGLDLLDRDLPGQRHPMTETPGQRPLSPWTETPHPWTETPRQRPPDRDPPPPHGKEWAVLILLECILVWKLDHF